MPTQKEIDEQNERQAAAAKNIAEADAAKADETIPGGKYILADGRTVNADGEELKGSKRAATAGGEEEDLESLTVEELKDRARDAEVSGFSTMNKHELVKAVKKAEKSQ